MASRPVDGGATGDAAFVASRHGDDPLQKQCPRAWGPFGRTRTAAHQTRAGEAPGSRRTAASASVTFSFNFVCHIFFFLKKWTTLCQIFSHGNWFHWICWSWGLGRQRHAVRAGRRTVVAMEYGGIGLDLSMGVGPPYVSLLTSSTCDAQSAGEIDTG